MPRICEFFGIIIEMYWNDHMPPHFHVKYNGYEASYDIRTCEMLTGDLPKKQMRAVEYWASRRYDDLMENWNLARNKQSLFKIRPLED